MPDRDHHVSPRSVDRAGAIDRTGETGELEFRELADYAPVMIWRAAADKSCDWFNKPWLDYAGRSMQQEVGFGWAERVHPDDRDRCIGIYVEAFDARRAFEREYRLLRHDGQFRWLLDNGKPFNRDGRFAGYFGSCVDVTSHRAAVQAQQLLIDELDHRVKNTLAVVQALGRQSFRSSQTPRDVEAFEARIAALSVAHDMLTRASWQSVGLEEILHEVLEPWCGHEERFSLGGPAIAVSSKAAVTLSIAFHELCTNATRHGALTEPGGHIDVSWILEGYESDEDDEIHIVWRESGGPAVREPERALHGFGMKMLKRALAGELKGTVEVRFPEQGLVCDIVAPVSRQGVLA